MCTTIIENTFMSLDCPHPFIWWCRCWRCDWWYGDRNHDGCNHYVCCYIDGLTYCMWSAAHYVDERKCEDHVDDDVDAFCWQTLLTYFVDPVWCHMLLTQFVDKIKASTNCVNTMRQQNASTKHRDSICHQNLSTILLWVIRMIEILIRIKVTIMVTVVVLVVMFFWWMK